MELSKKQVHMVKVIDFGLEPGYVRLGPVPRSCKMHKMEA